MKLKWGWGEEAGMGGGTFPSWGHFDVSWGDVFRVWRMPQNEAETSGGERFDRS